MFIVNPLKGVKGVNFAGLFSTHPPLQERIRRLRAMELRSIY
jgi:heat shock protein HtpX